jgi:3-phosphoshikimate 1-carboxyvinyltransferase
MPLPNLIEIVPLSQPVHAEISVPGSKSITNRALVLAALAEGETTLRGALWSEDTQVMAECLQELGFMVNVAPDTDEECNRTITVYGQGGRVPRGGTAAQPLELFVGNAGTAARFLAAMVCLGSGAYRLHGVGRMHERPQAALFAALRELGYRIDSSNDRLPAVIHGAGPRPGRCTVSTAESSQFASALLLSERTGGWSVVVTGENADESPYVAMTAKLREVFPPSGGVFQIEPDASSGSYFWAAGTLEVKERQVLPSPSGQGQDVEVGVALSVQVAHWPTSEWQIDQAFQSVATILASRSRAFAQELDRILPGNGPEAAGPPSTPRIGISRQHHLGDAIMTAIVMAPLLVEPVRFTHLGRLRVQECERVVALRTELTKCGAKVIEEGDTLTVLPSSLHGAEIETYDDHRMAMCFAILGLKVPGLRIKNPSCVKKTFPNFFRKLATPPPGGLGATIREAASGRTLGMEELFAD